MGMYLAFTLFVQLNCVFAKEREWRVAKPFSFLLARALASRECSLKWGIENNDISYLSNTRFLLSGL